MCVFDAHVSMCVRALEPVRSVRAVAAVIFSNDSHSRFFVVDMAYARDDEPRTETRDVAAGLYGSLPLSVSVGGLSCEITSGRALVNNAALITCVRYVRTDRDGFECIFIFPR